MKADDEPDHTHVVAYETGTGPDRHGALTITEHCTCGQTLRTYTDATL